MSKVDLVVMSVIATIMVAFFWLDTKWSFFGAGICGAVIFFISMGFWIRSLEDSHRTKEWDSFLNKLETDETIPEANVLHKEL